MTAYISGGIEQQILVMNFTKDFIIIELISKPNLFTAKKCGIPYGHNIHKIEKITQYNGRMPHMLPSAALRPARPGLANCYVQKEENM